MRYYSQPSNQRLIDAINPVLQEEHFPNLRTLHFAGVWVHDPLSLGEAQSKARLIEMCQSKGFQCDFLLGRRCIFDGDTGEVYKEDGMGADDF